MLVVCILDIMEKALFISRTVLPTTGKSSLIMRKKKKKQENSKNRAPIEHMTSAPQNVQVIKNKEDWEIVTAKRHQRKQQLM